MERIDIGAMLADKRPVLAKWLPRFAVRWLERIVHQDEINETLRHCGGLQGLDFVKAALEHLEVTYTLHGEAHLDAPRRKLYVSNHPLGGFDGIILLDILGRRAPDIKTIVNDLLMHLRPLRGFFLPVNKYGSQPRLYVRQMQEACSSDAPILYFPAGLCSRRTGGVIADPVWKPQALKIACAHRRDVVPIYFDGRNSNFFYRFANLRKSLGIRTSIETILLAAELFKQRGAHYNVYAGAPIPCASLLPLKTFGAMTAFVREKVYGLPKDYNKKLYCKK